MSRRVVAVALAGMLAMAGVWYVALWSPQSARLAQARAQSVAATQKQGVLASEVAVLQQGQSRLPALAAQLGVLNQAIPELPALDKVIDDIDAVGAAAGVKISSLTPVASSPTAAAAAGATGAAAIALTIASTGLYAQLIDFVNRLDSMPRLMVVDGLGFGAPDATGQISLLLNGRVFTAPAG